jgi:hypothetical protein
MVQVRTRDDAIALVDHALGTWAQTLTGILTQAEAVASAVAADAERLAAKSGSRVAAIEATLAAAPADDRRAREVELARARTSHDHVRRASASIADIREAVRQLRNRHARRGLPQTDAARAQLGEMLQALETYRRASASGPTASAGQSTSSGGRAAVDLTRFGLAPIDVGAADLADTPIVGEFGRGDASRADYRWAVQTWDDSVAPGVARGMSRDDFANRDLQIGAPPLRRTADVYDMFLGSDRIRVNRRPDGSLNIVNGRHRLQIASELGIRSLPGEVS